ncbi:stress response regulator protein 1 [[Candida] jaroonii]|uniref:Stress response regulator protein 1 n=1 Tax=[Candida] jaroonii TaxID=467808 RepID=A0ACA9Y558_9ASCO|nr:stress response regulator protein 1 [[Candida] jaroonii]
MLKTFDKLSINTNLSRNKSIQSNKSTNSINSLKSFKSSSSISSTSSNVSNKSVDYKIQSASSYLSPIEQSPFVPNYGKFKFLIVDDNLINLKILYKILSKIFPNAKIVKLSNSSTILKLIHQERFDLIFLDIEMPPINGIDISKKIRSMKHFNKLGLIAVTTRSNEKDLKIYKKIGIDYTFKKPLNYGLNIILNHVELVLNYRKNK